MTWDEIAERGAARYADGEARLPADPDARQRQLVRMAMAAGSVALARLMQGRGDEARAWFLRSAERYRESWAGAPPGSWGRPIGALKARLLAGDAEGAATDARWLVALDPAAGGSPIGGYAAALASLALGEDAAAARYAGALLGADFPPHVARAVAALAAGDGAAYADASAHVLASFEARDAYLEDVPVADTVLVLEALAEPRGLASRPASPLLPRQV